jgi:hypothetical protein
MQGVLTGLAIAMILGLVGVSGTLVRLWLARRREAACRPGAKGDVPVRFRGVAPAYPRFWRAGRLELATAVWRPRGPLGVPVSLAGARIREMRSW